jgi:hypothetical protein
VQNNTLTWLKRAALGIMLSGFMCSIAGATSIQQSAQIRGSIPNAYHAQLATHAISIRQSQRFAERTWLLLDESAHQQLLAAGIPFEAAPAPEIRFLSWRFDPLKNPPARVSTAPSTAQGHKLALLQFNLPASDTELQQLRNRGIEVLQYYPHNTYLVWAQEAMLQNTRSQHNIRWIGDFSSAYRTSPELRQFQGLVDQIHVHFYNPGAQANSAPPQAILDTLAQTGAELLNHFPAQPDQQFYEAILRGPASSIAALANIPQVIWIGYASPEPLLEDESGAQTVAGNFLPSGQPDTNYPAWLSSTGYDGSGVIWSVTDTGVDYSHPDFANHIIGGMNYRGCTELNPGNDPDSGGHGTHVAGILAGPGNPAYLDANGHEYGLGVAPGARLYVQNPVCGSQASWPPSGGWQELTKHPLLAGAVGTNYSWTTGEGTAHGYQASERIHDVIARDGNFDTSDIAEPIMVVFSAGNSGPGANTLTAPKEAKNVIVAGATQSWRVSQNVDRMYNRSSRGSAVDGRILPTIVAPGERVTSTYNLNGSQCSSVVPGTDNRYAYCSGTSMAAPHVSGALALITQWWRQLHAGQNPSPAMAKALLINTATEINSAGPIPNNTEGWGRVRLNELLDSSTSYAWFDQDYLFTETGQEWRIRVNVPNPFKPFKVSLVWSDAPGAVGANPALVNDLNLSVIANGHEYLGNAFTNGQSIIGGTIDALNNIENVFLSSAPGSAEVVVRAHHIAGDGVPYNGDFTDQDFALVCSNCSLSPDFALGTPDTQAEVCTGDQAQFPIFVDSVAGFSGPVSFALDNPPPSLSYSFSQNPATPPTLSLLTIDNTSALSAGGYPLLVNASASSGPRQAAFMLQVFEQASTQSVLLTPTNGQSNTELLPAFSWSGVNAARYRVEIDDQADFSSPELSLETEDTQLTLAQPLRGGRQYYWRVVAVNPCGESTSESFSFITEADVGSCEFNSATQVHFFDDFEQDHGTWQHEGNQDSWQRNDHDRFSGDYAWNASAPEFVSDQRLISPPIPLPTGNTPLSLQFYDRQAIEQRDPSRCWDGAVLEITSNGTDWAQINDSQLLSEPYHGTISSADNPLNGTTAWCGDPQDWRWNVVDLSPWQGELVQFRFRLATDEEGGRVDGWSIDDVLVQSCPSSDLIFSEGFESTAP